MDSVTLRGQEGLATAFQFVVVEEAPWQARGCAGGMLGSD